MGKIPVFYSEKSFLHNPPYEIFNGNKDPHAETPERIKSTMNALKNSEIVQISTATADALPWVSKVHDLDYLDFLKRSSDRLKEGEFIYPSVFPYTAEAKVANELAERGKYMFDLYTPIMRGTLETAVESAACAVDGAKLLLEGERVVYALSRPPGHHAERSRMGGYCYINNVAIAAEFLRANNARRIAIFDFDLHHGNGTQNIFYDRGDVLYVSIHASPEIKFPYYSGFSDEEGVGEGKGFNHNFPLQQDIGDDEYHAVVGKAFKIISDYKPDYLLVSAGFDTHEQDPIGAFKLSTAYYGKLGRFIADFDIPTLSVQEGGYATKVLGENVVTYIKGFV